MQEDGQLLGSPPKAAIKRLGKSLFGSTGLGSGAMLHTQNTVFIKRFLPHAFGMFRATPE